MHKHTNTKRDFLPHEVGNPVMVRLLKLYLRDALSLKLPTGSLGRLVGSNVTVGALRPGDAALVRCRAGCIVGGIDGRAAG